MRYQASGKPGTTSKRKGTCKPCRDASIILCRLRIVVGEEQPGGLVIVRAPPTRSTPSQDPHPGSQSSRSSSVQPPQQHPLNSNASKPPSKKFKASASEPDSQSQHIEPVNDAARNLANGKGKTVAPEVSDGTTSTFFGDARRAGNSFALNSISAASNPKFQFPQRSTPPRDRIHDSSVPIPASETPQIEKNKMMRGEMPHRRRSSISRGKRASSSFENTGVISECEYLFHPRRLRKVLSMLIGKCSAQPHTSVADSSFYKHIDVELPEPQRAQQLLIWCSHRTFTELTEDQQSSSQRSGRSTGKDPPPLSADDLQLLKGVQEDVVRLLAEKKIDTNVFSPPGASKAPQVLRENEKNVMNRERETKFNEKIQQCVWPVVILRMTY